MRVLLIANGAPHHLGAYFGRALTALGVDARLLDVAHYELAPGRPLAVRVAARITGYRRWLTGQLNRAALAEARAFRPDVVLVTGGGFMAPATLRALKRSTGAVLVNYATDDPFNPRHTSRVFIEGIPAWDIYATPRRSLLPDLVRHGAPRPAHVWCGYEPAVHFPEPPGPGDPDQFTADVVFAGGADPDRYPLLRRVAAEPGMALRLYGGFWDHDPVLRPAHHGFAYGRAYRLAIGGAKVSLCLVRKANRDGHVMRTFEIPAMGGFLLADRTEEHAELFAEDREAVFFSEPAELLDKLRFYLKDEPARRRIADAGRVRITSGSHTWKDRVGELLALAKSA